MIPANWQGSPEDTRRLLEPQKLKLSVSLRNRPSGKALSLDFVLVAPPFETPFQCQGTRKRCHTRRPSDTTRSSRQRATQGGTAQSARSRSTRRLPRRTRAPNNCRKPRVRPAQLASEKTKMPSHSWYPPTKEQMYSFRGSLPNIGFPQKGLRTNPSLREHTNPSWSVKPKWLSGLGHVCQKNPPVKRLSKPERCQ